MNKPLTAAMQSALARFESGDEEIRSGTGVSLGTVRALETRGLVTVETFHAECRNGARTWIERMWVAAPVRVVEVTTIDQIEYTEDGDRVRDENGDYGRTDEAEYEIEATEFGEIVSEVVEILRNKGIDQYSSEPDWQRHGWYLAETYEHPYKATYEEKTAHLRGFTEEQSRAIHAVITTPDHVKAAFVRTFTEQAKESLFYSELISLPEDPHERADIDSEILERDGHPFDDFYAESDLTEESVKEIETDCENFVNEMWHTLYNLDAQQCGHDFIMSRNGHGCGYWENDYGTKAQSDRLQKAAEPYSTLGLMLCADGTVETHN